MRNHFLRASGVPSVGSSFSGVTTNLEVHYDFGNTSSWSGNSSSNAADYTIYDLSGNNNNGIIKSNSSGSFIDSSANVSKDTSDGNSLVLGYTSSNYDDNATRTTLSSGAGAMGTGAGTVEMWIKFKFTDVSSEKYSFMLWWSSGPGGSLWYWHNTNSYTFSHYYPKHFSVGGEGGNGVIPYPGSPPDSGWGDWVHLVWSRTSTSSNETRVYINNSLEHTYTSTDDITTVPTGLMYAISSNPYDAKIGSYRYYNGTGLTSSQVTTNWNVDKTRFGY